MATNDAPNRVDKILAGGSQVDEVLNFSARDAIDRHETAGERVVVFRDGQTTRVSAEDLAHGRSLLTNEELAKERTAKDLGQWFEDYLSTINSCAAAKRPALLHQALFKTFYEEMYPLAVFVRHLYAGRQDLISSLNSTRSADRDYDAVIRDRSTSPPTVTYVQLTTTTFDHDESRRMQHFLKHGRVRAWGPVNEAGDVELEFVSQEEKLERTFDAIDRAARRKSGFSYGADYVLVVSFDDFMWFGTDDDLAALTSFVSQRLNSWRLKVATLYIVGISGRTFLSFPVPRA